MYKCDICEAEIQGVNSGEGIELVGGKQLKFVKDEKEHWVIRCDKCFETNKELRNFQPCEVYTRCVGYFRPVQQFHEGKQAEYRDRKEFKMTEETPTKTVVVEPTTEEAEVAKEKTTPE